MSSKQEHQGTPERLILAAAVCGWLTTPAYSATPLLTAEFSPDISISVSPLTIDDHDVVSDDAELSIVDLGTLPEGADVDGFHRAAQGGVLFSLNIADNLDGLVVSHGDVVRWDGVAYELVFDATSAGLPAGVDVDAVSEFHSKLILSFDTTVQLNNAAYSNEDLVQFDGQAFTAYFDASAAGIAEELNIDAASTLANGNILVSFDISGQVAGLTFHHADVLEYDPSNDTWEIVYQGTSHTGWGAADMDAFATDTDLDNDIVVDSGDNCLEVANPNQRDTNGDGFGNVCDADVTNDDIVNFADLILFRAAFFSIPTSPNWNPDTDLNGDSIVNFLDLSIVRQQFFAPPGPSGIAP